MLRLFTCYLLIFCGGCILPGASGGLGGGDPVFEESAARELCRANMLEVRIAENWQHLREELQYQTLELSLPGRIANLSAVPAPAEYQEIRKILHIAQMFQQELTAPDTQTARELLRTRSGELLDMELAELAAILQAKEQEISALTEALQTDPDAPELRKKLDNAREELENARMGIRPLLGIQAGHPFILQQDLVPPDPLPPDRKLETALACRPELQNSRFKPEELAAAVRACTDGKFTNSRHRALAAAATLLRAPRDLYRRELASRKAPEGMRELLTAIGIAAELELALEELQQAQKAAEAAALLAGKDPRSQAESARQQCLTATALVHLEAALGGKTTDYPRTGIAAEPNAQLLKLSALLEKWENE